MSDVPRTPEEVTNLIEIAPGVLVSDDVLGVVEWIRNYDPNLDVLYLDPSRFDIEPNDPPFKIIEKCSDGLQRIVMSVWQLDESVKERIYKCDTQRFSLELTFQQHKARQEAEQQYRFAEERGEDNELITHILKSPKTTYKFRNKRGELVWLEDDVGVIKRIG